VEELENPEKQEPLRKYLPGGNSGDAFALFLFLVLARCLTVRKALALVRGPAAAI